MVMPPVCAGLETRARLPNRRRYHRRMTGGAERRARLLAWLVVLAVLTELILANMRGLEKVRPAGRKNVTSRK
jgi:hypothetical protein